MVDFFSLFLGNTYAWQEVDFDDIDPKIEGVLESFEGEANNILGYASYTVSIFTEMDCDNIRITLGGNVTYSRCGILTGWENVPAGIYSSVVEGCGGRMSGYTAVYSDVNLVMCPSHDFAHLDCCPEGILSGGKYFCDECPKSTPTTTTSIPETSTTTSSSPITSTTSTSSTSTTSIPQYISPLDGTMWSLDMFGWGIGGNMYVGYCNADMYRWWYDDEGWENDDVFSYLPSGDTVFWMDTFAFFGFWGWANKELGDGILFACVVMPVPLWYATMDLISTEWTPDIPPPDTSDLSLEEIPQGQRFLVK